MSVFTNKKVLLPLATAALAGAIAVGSGATFTTTTGNTASAVTSGTLTQTNSKDAQAYFSQGNLKPGDVVTGTLTLTNTGSLRQVFSLTESKVANTFSAGVLTEKIEDVTGATPVSLFSGDFGTAPAKIDLGTFAPNEARKFKVTVTFAQSATTAEAGKTASETFSWDGTQESAQTYNQ